jgi:hypothetical protein
MTLVTPELLEFLLSVCKPMTLTACAQSSDLLPSSGDGKTFAHKSLPQNIDSIVPSTVKHTITATLTDRVAPRPSKLKAGMDGFCGHVAYDFGL